MMMSMSEKIFEMLCWEFLGEHFFQESGLKTCHILKEGLEIIEN